uniref:uncharacterized protein LOC120335338 isoform X2 n=1 Tax=Styela clava TaxID=7725 RepID=UPI00193A0219|nr:uncharacterized protein LOC120335338 isoform X2 [Styela clava]
MKCDSCSLVLPTAIKLFEHIQQSCLLFYKSHPASWAKILSSLDSDESTSTESKAVAVPHPPQMDATSTTKSSSPSPSSSSTNSTETPNSIQKKTKLCTLGKEPPFCIMFKGQDNEMLRPLKNVHMTVSDYFYGIVDEKTVKLKTVNRRCNCYSCGKTLRNNIRFMSHLRHKIINEWEKKSPASDIVVCQHCYRHYDSPFQLQCHVENVHGSLPAACSCRICELHFVSERTFLFHMKDKHVHNELPYVCKVCMYRSSHYSDVIKHFRDAHTDTTALMCPFCLTVSYNANYFLKHVIQHIKSSADCYRCRLKFVNIKDRSFHIQTDHQSQTIKEKAKKFKNLNKCQVYVRVSPLQLAHRQNLLNKTKMLKDQIESNSSGDSSQKPIFSISLLPKKQNIEVAGALTASSVETGSPVAKKTSSIPNVQLPAYLSPLKRPTRIKKLRMTPREFSVIRCHECQDSITIETDLLKHFSHYHECRWCVYVTACEKASHNHVLKEHADAEMREELTGRVEKPESPILSSAMVDEEEQPTPQVKKEPTIEVPDKQLLPPTAEATEEETTKSTHVNKSADTSKARRKQSNPMKIKNSDFPNSPSPKRVRKDRKVQTKTFEKQRGSQTFESDFAGADAEENSNSTSMQKGRSTAARSILSEDGVKIGKRTSTFTPAVRKRKILAPEGFFPDIEDDAGWAKYFKECEDKTQSDSSFNIKVTVPMSALPTMVPIQTTVNTQLKSSNSSILTFQKKLPTTIATPGLKNVASDEQGASPIAGLSTVVRKVNSDTAAISPGNVVISKTKLATNSNNKPVYQFHIVPKSQKNKPTPIAPKHNSSSTQPLFGLINKVQSMLSQVPRTPVDLRCLEVTHSTLLVQWDAPINCVVTHYKVVFQGAGAPTVQLLPPEQTLVRLVGLKSDTMYVVRVYTLYNQSVSQYAFLYQKTNKLRDSTTKPVDDVVLVLDDNEPLNTLHGTMPTSKKETATTKNINGAAKTTTTAEKSFVPATSSVSSLTSTSHNSITTDQQQALKKQLQDESEKKKVINELLAGFKKNKNQKNKTVKSNIGLSAATETAGKETCIGKDNRPFEQADAKAVTDELKADVDNEVLSNAPASPEVTIVATSTIESVTGNSKLMNKTEDQINIVKVIPASNLASTDKREEMHVLIDSLNNGSIISTKENNAEKSMKSPDEIKDSTAVSEDVINIVKIIPARNQACTDKREEVHVLTDPLNNGSITSTVENNAENKTESLDEIKDVVVVGELPHTLLSDDQINIVKIIPASNQAPTVGRKEVHVITDSPNVVSTVPAAEKETGTLDEIKDVDELPYTAVSDDQINIVKIFPASNQAPTVGSKEVHVITDSPNVVSTMPAVEKETGTLDEIKDVDELPYTAVSDDQINIVKIFPANNQAFTVETEEVQVISDTQNDGSIISTVENNAGNKMETPNENKDMNEQPHTAISDNAITLTLHPNSNVSKNAIEICDEADPESIETSDLPTNPVSCETPNSDETEEISSNSVKDDKENMQPQTDDCDLGFNIVNIVSLSNQSKVETNTTNYGGDELVATERSDTGSVNISQEDILPETSSLLPTNLEASNNEKVNNQDKKAGGLNANDMMELDDCSTNSELKDENISSKSPTFSLPISPVPPSLKVPSTSTSDEDTTETERADEVADCEDIILNLDDSPILQTENDSTDSDNESNPGPDERELMIEKNNEKDVDEVQSIVNQQTSICDSTPTLDDIKDIINEDLSWL